VTPAVDRGAVRHAGIVTDFDRHPAAHQLAKKSVGDVPRVADRARTAMSDRARLPVSRRETGAVFMDPAHDRIVARHAVVAADAPQRPAGTQCVEDVVGDLIRGPRRAGFVPTLAGRRSKSSGGGCGRSKVRSRFGKLLLARSQIDIGIGNHEECLAI